MIGELTIWLMVYASDPNTRKTYLIEDKKEPGIEVCVFDSIEWLKKGLKVKRGDWILSVRCDLEHEEGHPASFKPPEIKQEKKEPVPEMRKEDNGSGASSEDDQSSY